MIEMAQDPVRGPDPVDPHEQCERDIALIEAEAEAAKQVTRLSGAQLRTLVGALLPDQSFIITVHIHHSPDIKDDRFTWSISYGFKHLGQADSSCEYISADSASELYAKLGAALPAKPFDDVGDISW